MAKRRYKKKRRAGRAIFILEIFVLFILIAGIAALAFINKKADNVSQDNTLNLDNVKINEKAVTSETLHGYTNIMIVGIDSRGAASSDGSQNSDVMMIASINNDTKEVRLVSIYRDTLLNTGEYKGKDLYTKANNAYALGGAERMLSMVNTNLDLDISEYVTVDFSSVAEVIDLLGGLDITMTADEVVHMNNYCQETSKVTGKDYVEIPEEDGTYHLNGVQAVSYARIRYTAGNDFKRAQRQRLVIYKIVEKAKTSDLAVLNDIMDTVFPMVTTSFTKSELIKMGTALLDYSIAGSQGFPYDHLEVNGLPGRENLDCVVPVTLANNVSQLHNFLFGEEGYQVSETCQSYSDEIVGLTQYGEQSIDRAKAASEDALPPTGSESDGL
ncbi:MAG TPA: LCP family protein [Lachnospiraceae bacterium]